MTAGRWKHARDRDVARRSSIRQAERDKASKVKKKAKRERQKAYKVGLKHAWRCKLS